MNKILICIFTLTFLICTKGLNQNLVLEKWYLEYLFLSINNPWQQNPIGLPLFWQSNQANGFLLDKLQSSTRGTAITYMGMSKDTSFLKPLSEIILDENEDEDIKLHALVSLARIGGDGVTNLLNQSLLKMQNDPISSRRILNEMKLLADLKTLKSIYSYKDALQPINEKNKKLEKIANDVIETIKKFNKNSDSRRQLILDNLNDEDNLGWSLFQLYKLRDTSYLEDLRKMQPSLGETLKIDREEDPDAGVYNRKFRAILQLRLFLNDDQLTPEEESYVAKNPHIWPLEKRYDLIRQEIEFLEKNGYGKD